MNTLFISVKSFDKLYGYKLIKKEDEIFKNTFCLLISDSSLSFFVNYINDYSNNKNKSKGKSKNKDKKISVVFKEKFFKHSFDKKIKNMFKEIKYLNVVFEDSLDEYFVYIGKYIQNLCGISINVIKKENTMLKHDIAFIDEYVENNEDLVTYDNLKILVVIDNITDTISKKIEEYITRYKFVDVCQNTSNIVCSKGLEKLVLSLNEEYGSTIEVISKKDLSEYNICICFVNEKKDNMNVKYIFDKKSKYIDMLNADEDYLNENVIEYNKNIEIIKKWLDFNDEFCFDINKFSKTKLGKVYSLIKDVNTACLTGGV